MAIFNLVLKSSYQSVLNGNRSQSRYLETAKLSSNDDLKVASTHIQNLNSLQNSFEDKRDYVRNAKEMSEIISVAQKAMSSMLSDLEEMRDLADFTAFQGISSDVREAKSQSFYENMKNLQSTSRDAKYKGEFLLTGKFTDQTFQYGPNDGESYTFNIPGVTSGDLGLSELSLASYDDSINAMQGIEEAIATVSAELLNLNQAKVRLDEVMVRENVSNLRTSQLKTNATEMSFTLSPNRRTYLRNFSREHITTSIYSANLFASNKFSIFI